MYYRRKLTTIILITLALVAMFLFAACERPLNDPALFVSGSNDDLGCAELTHNGKTYRPFGVILDRAMRDTKLGFRDGDSELPIYSVKGYDSTEWIIEADNTFMGGSDWLYKEISVHRTPEELESFREYSFDVPGGYTLDDAKRDHCVVFEDSRVTSGQSEWDNFVSRTEEKKPCYVRLAFYYTLDDQNISPEHYEEIKDDYPALYIQDLKFNGSHYQLMSSEDGKHYSDVYSYMKKYTEGPLTSDAKYSEWTRYVPVNDDSVTWGDIFRGMISSQSGASIDHKTVYSDIK